MILMAYGMDKALKKREAKRQRRRQLDTIDQTSVSCPGRSEVAGQVTSQPLDSTMLVETTLTVAGIPNPWQAFLDVAHNDRRPTDASLVCDLFQYQRFIETQIDDVLENTQVASRDDATSWVTQSQQERVVELPDGTTAPSPDASHREYIFELGHERLRLPNSVWLDRNASVPARPSSSATALIRQRRNGSHNSTPNRSGRSECNPPSVSFSIVDSLQHQKRRVKRASSSSSHDGEEMPLADEKK